jgi:outer membrane protein assembly factor BamB
MCGAAMSDGVVFFGTEGGVIYALDQRRGKRVWKHEVYLGAGVIATPTVADGRLHIVTNGKAKAFDAVTGELLWSKSRGGTNDGFRIRIPKAKGFSRGDFAPLVRDGVVYLSELRGTFVALDAASGELSWSYPTGEERGMPGDLVPPVHRYASGDGVVYYQSRGGELWAFDISEEER